MSIKADTTHFDIETSTVILSGIKKLGKDLSLAATTLGDREARFLVDLYYNLQDYRIASAGQIRSLSKTGEPHAILKWYEDQFTVLEKSAKTALERYASTTQLGGWCQSITMVGPVITAGLLANIDLKKARFATNLWSFAGLNPKVKWEKGKKRPWNASLKRLCFIIGDCFCKGQNLPSDNYGRIFASYKKKIVSKNEQGLFSETAKRTLETKNFRKDTIAKRAYEEGKLPDERLQLMAVRYVAKLFLSHYHAIGLYLLTGKVPSMPYCFSDPNARHQHILLPPNLHLIPGFESAVKEAWAVSPIGIKVEFESLDSRKPEE